MTSASRGGSLSGWLVVRATQGLTLSFCGMKPLFRISLTVGFPTLEGVSHESCPDTDAVCLGPVRTIPPITNHVPEAVVAEPPR